MSKSVELSIVIPVHNEESILADSVAGLLDRVPALTRSFEILLCENGSHDRTLAIAAELEARHPEVSHLHLEEPNYGRALKAGIQRARGTFVLCDEIDLCDTHFYENALKLLRSGEADMVIGSKMATGAKDERPVVRHVATWVLNRLLRVVLNFKGTDTHGLKAFRRDRFMDVVNSCVVERDLFASEFVIRSERAGRALAEVPLLIHEKRPPTINLFRRVPRALTNLATLFWVIRVREKLPLPKTGWMRK